MTAAADRVRLRPRRGEQAAARPRLLGVVHPVAGEAASPDRARPGDWPRAFPDGEVPLVALAAQAPVQRRLVQEHLPADRLVDVVAPEAGRAALAGDVRRHAGTPPGAAGVFAVAGPAEALRAGGADQAVALRPVHHVATAAVLRPALLRGDRRVLARVAGAPTRVARRAERVAALRVAHEGADVRRLHVRRVAGAAGDLPRGRVVAPAPEGAPVVADDPVVATVAHPGVPGPGLAAGRLEGDEPGGRRPAPCRGDRRRSGAGAGSRARTRPAGPARRGRRTAARAQRSPGRARAGPASRISSAASAARRIGTPTPERA